MVDINKAYFGAGKDRGITGPLYRTIFNLKNKPSEEQKTTIERYTELLGNKMLEIVQSWSNICCEFQWDASTKANAYPDDTYNFPDSILGTLHSCFTK